MKKENIVQKYVLANQLLKSETSFGAIIGEESILKQNSQYHTKKREKYIIGFEYFMVPRLLKSTFKISD